MGEITWDNGRMESKLIGQSGMETPVWLERVLIMGAAPGSGPAKVVSPGGESSADTEFNYNTKVMTIRKPGVNLGKDWSIQCQL